MRNCRVIGHMHVLAAAFLLLMPVFMPGCGDSGAHSPSHDSPDSGGAEFASSSANSFARPASTKPNAADAYRRIGERMGKDFLNPLAYLDYDTAPDADEVAFLVSQQDLIEEIIAASLIPYCDFETDFSRGQNTEMPHLSWLHRCARLLRYDAERYIRSPVGQRGASDRLAAIVRIAKHVGEEPTFISKMVGQSCLGLAADASLKWRDRLTDSQAKAKICSELEAISTSALFDLHAALHGELDIIRNTINHSTEPLMIMPEVSISIAENEKAPLIAEIERLFGEIEAVCDLPDAEYKVKQILDGIRIIKAKPLVAGIDGIVRRQAMLRQELDAAISVLRE